MQLKSSCICCGLGCAEAEETAAAAKRLPTILCRVLLSEASNRGFPTRWHGGDRPPGIRNATSRHVASLLSLVFLSATKKAKYLSRTKKSKNAKTHHPDGMAPSDPGHIDRSTDLRSCGRHSLVTKWTSCRAN